LVFPSNLLNSASFMVLIFAVDTKVSRKIYNENDGALLQQDLERLMERSKDCHLDFNVEKCTIMRVKHSFQTEYEFNGRKLQEVAEERDLEILFTDDL